MAAELILLGTAAAPMPVAGRAGISSALVIDGRIFVVDCGRGSPSAFANIGLDFRRLEALFITHYHCDHIGDLPGMLIYPWGVRSGSNGPLPPICVYGPSMPPAPLTNSAGGARETPIGRDLPTCSATELVDGILTAFSYHLAVMPLDAQMPDSGDLVRGIDIVMPPTTPGTPEDPIVVFEDDAVKVRSIAVTHGHAVPAVAYRFDTADGSVVFSGDTTVNDDLIALAQGADILVHCVADLAYLERHGTTGVELERMAGLHTDVTEVGGVAERARVKELILTHYLPAEPSAVAEAEWAARAAASFSGRTIAGRDGLRRDLTAMRRPA